ncbi:PhzF family phenazine biosynthesis protein [Acidicapsa ligni]|uniref:PhzF family phenazine biosynthesis protein n=1 Tax=Acidicapsa ligni TaxID=542300 RepID=UPI0021DF6634|nr:PhzF family phenazine biosynthesis protein [Acidicapsa ligni]
MSKSTEAIGTLDYFVLDVFTKTRLTGNPLAVVLNPGNLTTELMQAIARETNLSETAFVERREPRVEQREGVRVRIFTTEEELPFAGHPTLGTASLLRSIAPECVLANTVTLALNVGAVPVRFDVQEPDAPAWPVRGEMTQKDPTFGQELDHAEVAALTGFAVEDFAPGRPIQVVSTGTAFAIVPLRSAAGLTKLRVRQQESAAYLKARGARWFYVLGPEDPIDPTASGSPAELAWRARLQFSGGEDPATGSAAGCAISYLVKHGVVASDQTVHLRQGVEMQRPSHIFLRANRNVASKEIRVTDVRVGGSTILVAKGQLFLP